LIEAENSCSACWLSTYAMYDAMAYIFPVLIIIWWIFCAIFTCMVFDFPKLL